MFGFSSRTQSLLPLTVKDTSKRHFYDDSDDVNYNSNIGSDVGFLPNSFFVSITNPYLPKRQSTSTLQLPQEIIHQIIEIILAEAVSTFLPPSTDTFSPRRRSDRYSAYSSFSTLTSKREFHILPLLLTNKAIHTYVARSQRYNDLFVLSLVDRLRSYSSSSNYFTVPIGDSQSNLMHIRFIRLPGLAFNEIMCCSYERDIFDHQKLAKELVPKVRAMAWKRPELFTFEKFVNLLKAYGRRKKNKVVFPLALNPESDVKILKEEFGFITKWIPMNELHERACIVWQPEENEAI